MQYDNNKSLIHKYKHIKAPCVGLYMEYFPRDNNDQEGNSGNKPGGLSVCNIPGRYSVVECCFIMTFSTVGMAGSAAMMAGSSFGISVSLGRPSKLPWFP